MDKNIGLNMALLFIIISIFTPRIVIFLVYLFTDWLSRAYETTLWPFLGFLLMPYTTLMYMAAMLYNDHKVTGLWLLGMGVVIFFDLIGQEESRPK